MTRRVAAVVAAVLAGLVASAAASPAAATVLRPLERERLNHRLLELRFATPALSRPTAVRVLLPRGYARHPHRRYPVLYLLHGGGNAGMRDWTAQGHAQRLTAGLPLIVVMPAGGNGGWYTDWYNGGAGGPPEWERYHVGELIPTIDARFRTVARRRGRAIAGLSMGGFGAFSYAARHPDLFAAAASFSGAVNTNLAPIAAVVDLASVFDGGPRGAIWGDRATQEARWRAHNPWDLAANLRGVALTLRTGQGPDPIEAGVHEATVTMHRRLRRLGIPHRFADVGPRPHAWPGWRADLRATLPWLMRTFRVGSVSPPAGGT